MKNRKIRLPIVALIATLMLTPAPTWAGPVTDQMKETLDELIHVLNDRTLKEEGKEKQRNAMLHNVLKKRFDEEAFARKSLGAYWKRITPEEKREFIALFSNLLEQTYFEKIDAQLDGSETFSGSDIHYLKEKVKGKNAQLTTSIKAGDNYEVPVMYLLKQVDGKWLVIDMKIEGVIISKNYRSQFSEVLSRGPMSELLEKLRAKQAVE